MQIQELIGLYAAVLSTALLAWEFVKYYLDKRPKIRVQVGTRSQALVYHNRGIGEWQDMLHITVTNVGNYRRLINKPVVKTKEKISNGDFFSLIDMADKNRYPCPLDPGEQYEYTIEKSLVLESFKEKGVTKIKIIVQDTHQKTHKSKWMQI